MEYLLLMKVGMVIKGLVWGGYTVAGGYFGATAMRYVKDYKKSVANDKSW